MIEKWLVSLSLNIFQKTYIDWHEEKAKFHRSTPPSPNLRKDQWNVLATGTPSKCLVGTIFEPLEGSAQAEFWLRPLQLLGVFAVSGVGCHILGAKRCKKIAQTCHTSAFFVQIFDFKSFIFVICVCQVASKENGRSVDWWYGFGSLIRVPGCFTSLHVLTILHVITKKYHLLHATKIWSLAQDLVPAVHMHSNLLRHRFWWHRIPLLVYPGPESEPFCSENNAIANGYWPHTFVIQS